MGYLTAASDVTLGAESRGDPLRSAIPNEGSPDITTNR
jgi:hypothetical protein